jgi:TolA-binding protein
MNLIICIGTFIFILIAYTIFVNINTKSTALIEGLENNNSSCDSDVKTLVFKNAGTIQNLQNSVDTLSKQVNTLVLSNDRQEVDIQNLKTLEAKVEKVSNQANELANENKNRLLEMAKEAKAKSDNVSNQIQNMPSP